MQSESSRTAFQQQLEELKEKVDGLEEQLSSVRRRIRKLQPATRGQQYAVIDKNRCTGCGMCAQACPVGAVDVTYVAHVNTQRCKGCGICVENCPQEAIRLSNGRTATSKTGRPQQDA